MFHSTARALVPFAFLSSVIAAEYSFEDAQAFLKQHCQACHSGKVSAGGFNLQRVSTRESLQSEAQKWTSLTTRVVNGEMPPKNSPAPPLELREQFAGWVNHTLRAEACSTGIT